MEDFNKALRWLLDELEAAEENGQEEFTVSEIEDFMDEIKNRRKEYGY